MLHWLQSLALDYARNHLRSELAWTKAKLVMVSHMASMLRAKLQAAQVAHSQAGKLWLVGQGSVMGASAGARELQSCS